MIECSLLYAPCICSPSLMRFSASKYTGGKLAGKQLYSSPYSPLLFIKRL